MSYTKEKIHIIVCAQALCDYERDPVVIAYHKHNGDDEPEDVTGMEL
jgi:hypothetical protein